METGEEVAGLFSFLPPLALFLFFSKLTLIGFFLLQYLFLLCGLKPRSLAGCVSLAGMSEMKATFIPSTLSPLICR